MKQKIQQTGFTIVELLIVIIVIGILAALVMNTFSGAQQKARLASANNGVTALLKGVKKLETETNKKGFGCPAGDGVYDPEGAISNAASGIMVSPTLGSVQGNALCSWSASDVSGWLGPYLNDAKDPWKTDYMIDNDYGICENGSAKMISAVLSAGPNKTINYPTSATSGACTVIASDDIYRQVR